VESSQVTREQINGLRQLSEDELLRTIYYQTSLDRNMKIMSVAEGKSKISENEKRKDSELGKGFMKNIESKLKKAICDQWKYCDKRKEFFDDLNKLATAIIPLVVAATAVSMFAAAAIAVLLVFKWGLDKFCGCSK
jgi:hypothetical protein